MNLYVTYIAIAASIVFLVLFLTKSSSSSGSASGFREITLDYNGQNFGGDTQCVQFPIQASDRSLLISTTNWTGSPDVVRLSFVPQESSQNGLSAHVALGLIDPVIVGFRLNTNPGNSSSRGQVYNATPSFFTTDSKFGVVFDASPLSYAGATSTMQLCLFID